VTLGTSREPRYGKIAERRNMSLYKWSKIGKIKEGRNRMVVLTAKRK